MPPIHLISMYLTILIWEPLICDRKTLESLRIAIQSRDMDGHHITTSIGVAYYGEEQVQNYEKAIA